MKESFNQNRIQLLDGGIYDNTAITGLRHALIKNKDSFVIVSDANEIFDRKGKYFNFLNQIKRTGLIILDRKTRIERQSIVNDFERRIEKNGSIGQAKFDGVIFLIDKECKYYRDYESYKKYVPDSQASIPDDMGMSKEVVNQLSSMRTDFDKFFDVEIEYLKYHGASLLDVSLRKWHPALYGALSGSKLNPPIPYKKGTRVLLSCHITFLFSCIRRVYPLWHWIKGHLFKRN